METFQSPLQDNAQNGLKIMRKMGFQSINILTCAGKGSLSKDKISNPQKPDSPGHVHTNKQLLDMAVFYHYTNSENLISIVKEEKLRCSDGAGFSANSVESVFLTRKV